MISRRAAILALGIVLGLAVALPMGSAVASVSAPACYHYCSSGAGQTHSPPPTCSGDQCTQLLRSQVHYSGDYSPGENNPVPVPPPPCFTAPFENGPGMYRLWTTQQSNIAPGATVWDPWGPQIKAHRTDTRGMWWQSYGSASDCAAAHLPLLQWVGPGKVAPAQHLPPRTLALYALKVMTVAAPALKTSPAPGKNIVNLPTYVSVDVARMGRTARYVTASIPGETVTVWGVAAQLSLTTSGPGRLAQPCAPAGSAATTTQLDHAKPGTLPDCGMLFSAPGSYTLSGIESWRATWGTGPASSPGAQSTPLATLNWPPGGAPVTVTVKEIQSLNGG